MSKVRNSGLAWCAIAAIELLVTAVAPAQGPACCPELSLESLAQMSWPELEALYRAAEPGPMPEGYTRGRAIYCLDSKVAVLRSRLTKALWHGKHFCGAEGTLVNQWAGFKAIHARVCYGESWLDGRPSIVMDYRGMSHVWHDVRDEVRQVAPGLYLGRMYRCKDGHPEFQFFFALECCP